MNSHRFQYLILPFTKLLQHASPELKGLLFIGQIGLAVFLAIHIFVL